MNETIIIGSDKSGFALKEAVKQWLTGQGFEVRDVGTRDVENFMPYFKVAPVAARAIQNGEAKRAVLVCGTGMGMAIAANKFKGIYAAVCDSVYGAKMSAVINKANVLTLGGWVTAPELAFAIVKAWLDTPFGEGFPPERVEFLQNAFEQIKAIENENFNGGYTA